MRTIASICFTAIASLNGPKCAQCFSISRSSPNHSTTISALYGTRVTGDIEKSNDDNVASSTNRRLLFFAGGVTAANVALQPLTAAAAAAEVSKSFYIPPPNSMDGKTVVITGGNTGLGLESGKRLAAAGAEVVLTTRTLSKGEQAVADVRKYLADQGMDAKSVRVHALTLDLADFESVKKFPAALKTLLGKRPVDVLMNNAGVMAIQDLEITKDGNERTFQTNHLGHFALTAGLAPMLSPDARIINVSSEAWQFAAKGIEFDNLNAEREFGPWSSYGLSKLSNILFTQELQIRADQAGKHWTVTSLHPGAVATDLARYIIGEQQWNDMKTKGMTTQQKLLLIPLSKFTKTVEEGASTQIFLAADAEPTGAAFAGKYFVDLRPKSIKSSVLDPATAQKLWSVSEDMTGIKFQL